MTRTDLIAKAKQVLLGRKRTYQTAALHPAVQEMLRDLAKFCYAGQVPYTRACVHNPDLKLILLGRQEVWYRIQNHLNLDVAQLYEIYTAKGDNDVPPA